MSRISLSCGDNSIYKRVLKEKFTVTDDSTNAGRRRFLVGSTSVVGAAGVGEAERRTHTHAVAVRTGRVHVVQEEPGV